MRQKPTYRLLSRFLSGLKKYFLLAIFASAVSIVAGYLIPRIVSVAVDSLVASRELSDLGLYGAGIVLCAMISAAFNYLSRMNIAKGTESFAKRLRDALFSHVQSLPFKWHVENQTGDIIQRCTYDVEMVRDFIAGQLIEVIRTIVLLAVAIGLMLSIHVPLAALALAFIPVIVGYSLFFYGKISREFLKADEAEGELLIDVQEYLTGVRVVKAFGRERYELNKFNEKNDLFTRKWIELGHTLGTYWGIGDIAMGLQIMSVVVLGAYFAAHGSITLGQFIAFVSYTYMLLGPVRSLGRTLSEMSKAGVSINRIAEILDAPAEEEEKGALKPDLRADIVFENVSFSYGDTQVLKNLNFTIEKGSTFGILGGTGSGKSTVTYLLSRLYDLPEHSGRILIGGVDIRDINRKYLRKNMGLVLQEPFLFSKTIRENIEIAVGRKDLEKVRASAAVANVDDNIMEFAGGYDTTVGERGVTLSGGQKQRVAIARTLMLDAPVMIFDDSLSAVDMETDAKIREELRENTGGATVILISHRVSTLMYADKILVLEEGRQAELGTGRELIDAGGVYSRVYKLQSRTEDQDGV